MEDSCSSQFFQGIVSTVDFESITDIVTDPSIPWKQVTGKQYIPYKRIKYVVEGFRKGTWIRVVIEPDGRGVLTAFFLDAKDGEQYAHPPG
jgi:hypothetical protein